MFVPPPFHPDRPGLVAPVRVDPTGLAGPTRAQARGRGWRTTSRGLFVPVSAPSDDPQQRSVEAAALLRGDGEAVTGWAALYWLAGRWFDGTRADGSLRPVPLVTDREVSGRPGVRISQEHLRHLEVRLVDGLAVTVPVRSVSFETRYAGSWWDAVVALDMACYSDLVSIAEMADYAAVIGPWTGIGQLRKAVAHADENAWSPREVIMRLRWTEEAQRPRPRCNIPVFDLRGRHLGTPDLFDPRHGVAGEYEGVVHLVGAQRARDVRREAAFREAGVETVTMVADEPPGAFVLRLHQAYERAGRHARGWTVDPPPWWVPTDTVARRRALTPSERSRLLRYRRAA